MRIANFKLVIRLLGIASLFEGVIHYIEKLKTFTAFISNSIFKIYFWPS